MTEFEQFEAWAKEKGHYQTVEAIARYRAYMANRKENESEALRERIEGD